MSVAVLYAWRRPGCGGNCRRVQGRFGHGVRTLEVHDPAAHEAYGRLRSADPRPAVRVGPLLVDARLGVAEVDGEPVRLTATQRRVLEYLALHAGQLCRRADLLRAVWGEGYEGAAHLAAVQVNCLRKRLGRAGALIETVIGLGYRLPAPDAADPLAGAIDHANDTLDWIESRRDGPLPGYGYARIETTVSVVRALRKGGRR